MKNQKVEYYTIEEMTQMFLEEKPWAVPNAYNVGRFAGQRGFTRCQSCSGKEKSVAYVRPVNPQTSSNPQTSDSHA